MHHFFPAIPFQMIRGQKEGAPLKPHPRPALEAAKHLRVPPQECLMLGDSDVDMKTARSAGMLPVGAAWGFRSTEELLKAGAAYIVRNPLEIDAWFDGKRSG
jgi:phosphoglycolate phosphatase